ncbi:MAG: hypothetical protein DRP01_10645 [Archaeoglobales archaeon]|nr:MAG: hypothetical protein DRP01_10645 [Archaeoglobales archaeon]
MLINGKPDIGMSCNGAIAGLVAINLCAWVQPWTSVLIGVVAGFIACYGYWWLERRCIDDVVGAIPVHGFAGTWGLLLWEFLLMGHMESIQLKVHLLLDCYTVI